MHMIGPDAYTKLICNNNAFFQSVTTIPSGDFQHKTLEIPFSTNTTMDIDTMMLAETILEQPWCLSHECTMTPNKILLVMTKGLLQSACKWVDKTLPDLYNQNITDKLDITPWWLDKPTITSASATYADKLKLHMAFVTMAPKQTQFNWPPQAQHTKLADLTFDDTATQKHNLASTQSVQQGTPTTTTTTAPLTSATLPFDYHAKLKCITLEIETTLKAKLKVAIANLQSSVDTLERKFEQKLNQQIELIKVTQANKSMQDTHLCKLEEITKSLCYLIDKVPLLIDTPRNPMLANSTGKP